MDITPILAPLNDAQREAVSAPPGAMLVLAGAGSGKTRVLVHRIAWLLTTEGVSPYAILAVTFTNKASSEMRGRIEQLLGMPTQGMWVGTFHGLAHRLLRLHWHEAGLPQQFQIFDSDDQQRLIRRVIKALQLDESQWPAKQVQGYINTRKDEGLRAAHIKNAHDSYAQQMLRIYQAYEEACERLGAVDFAELLLRAYELWQRNTELLAHYQARFQHVLVDEFQDTNGIQYAWLRLLANAHGRLFIVGDDDQSIYGWRGAKVENIRRFQQDFSGVAVVRLEQNYRSTGVILAAANALITCNTGRLGKELWTEGVRGDPVRLYQGFNDLDEARFVAERIKAWREQGGRLDECAILYRSNAQSRVFEEALLRASLPYRVYGGLRFFERAEIKDALAYLRLIAHRADDAAFERAVNTPTRGIGERTLESVREQARVQQTPLWDAARALLAGQQLATRAAYALQAFLHLIDDLARATAELALGEQVELAIRRSGLREHFAAERGDRGEARIENLEELATAARQFMPRDEEDLPLLSSFLAHAALEAGDVQADDWQDCVQLMTLHTAKGLEFPLVFMAGMEEGLFPHHASAMNEARLEEERRLCYVGITRARRLLYFTCAERRRLHGTETTASLSRFVSEIPAELVEEVRLRGAISMPLQRPSTGFAPRRDESALSVHGGATSALRLGVRVHHQKFGEGVVLRCEGHGAQARVQVNFSAVGAKWLVTVLAKLQVL